MKKYLLILICILFLLTRLYKINEIPSSVYWDEASIGYNAYSIIQTGKDEWGKSFPLHFRAFGEFKLPVYIYATAPFIKAFGLNAFSVRLPAVLFSLGVVILTYFLTRKLSGITLGLLSSFFVAISPWFFIFSRTGYEASAGLMFYLLAIYLFLLIKNNSWYLLFSIISFILSAYSYNSFRIISPVTIFVLILFNVEKLKSLNKKGIALIALSVMIIIISVIPIYKLYRYDSGFSRFQAVGNLNLKSFLSNYISHFNPEFLLRGDKNLRSQQPGFGQIYWPELVLLPLGILYIIRSKSRYKFLPLILLLLGPIPSSVTKESPHALRAISAVPFISIISATGGVALGRWMKRGHAINLIIVVIFFYLFTNYFLNFLNKYSAESAKDWQYEYKKIYTDYTAGFDNYSRILISDKYAQPYIFTLFYLKYDPEKFRQEVERNSVDQWGYSTVKKFGKFEFGKFPELAIYRK